MALMRSTNMMYKLRHEILDIICEWAIIKNIRVSPEESLAFGVLSGIGITAGGIFFGRLGMMAAASISALCASVNVKEAAVSLAHLIKNVLTAVQRTSLTNLLMSFVADLAIDLTAGLLNKLFDEKISSTLTQLLEKFVCSEFERKLMF